ncbi:hypothetical protein [Ornithinimicrobium kibberense]|uniref:hypothetical protein n=1 Tax=Ornithinimicrobium kibberense TaxID=282060 RepID=UPI003615DB54
MPSAPAAARTCPSSPAPRASTRTPTSVVPSSGCASTGACLSSAAADPPRPAPTAYRWSTPSAATTRVLPASAKVIAVGGAGTSRRWATGPVGSVRSSTASIGSPVPVPSCAPSGTAVPPTTTQGRSGWAASRTTEGASTPSTTSRRRATTSHAPVPPSAWRTTTTPPAEPASTRCSPSGSGTARSSTAPSGSAQSPRTGVVVASRRADRPSRVGAVRNAASASWRESRGSRSRRLSAATAICRDCAWSRSSLARSHQRRATREATVVATSSSASTALTARLRRRLAACSSAIRAASSRLAVT